VLDPGGILFYDFRGATAGARQTVVASRAHGQAGFCQEHPALRIKFYHPLSLAVSFDGEGMPRQLFSWSMQGGASEPRICARPQSKICEKQPIQPAICVILPELILARPDYPCFPFSGARLLLTNDCHMPERGPAGLPGCGTKCPRGRIRNEKIIDRDTLDGLFWSDKGPRTRRRAISGYHNQSIREMLRNVRNDGPRLCDATGEEAFENGCAPLDESATFHFSEFTQV